MTFSLAASKKCRSLVASLLCLMIFGCNLQKPNDWSFDCNKCNETLVPGSCPAQLEIDVPCASGCLADQALIPIGPNEIGVNDEVNYFHLSLEQAISMALQQSKVLRDLGGTVLRNPDGSVTAYDPATAYTDPQFGEEAALSAFDANLVTSIFYDKNDRDANSSFIGTNGALQQDLGNYNVALRKRAMTGTQMVLRHVTEYDANNFTGNQYPRSWQTYLDAEVRQPLLQGAGIRFNQIAGPSNEPGVANGVLIARIRNDISLADFEIGVRNLVSDVENAYWDLYFAYYDLDAKKYARDEALALWNKKQVSRKADGEASVQQALEQYWRFESAVLDAYNGSLNSRTSTNNGSAAGSFRNSGGVRVAERRLRLIVGLPVNSVQLIKPISNPPEAPLQFDWAICASEALSQRAELRRQRWRVKQRELELIASKNFLAPRLDVIGRYRWRGFGNSLLNPDYDPANPHRDAWGNLTNGDNQEWRLGLELDVPLGFRKGHAAVRNAELRLARDNTILKEQERFILYGLSNAFGEVERSYLVLQAQTNRMAAAEEQVKIFLLKEDNAQISTDLLLESQRQLVDSQIAYYQSRVEYVLALKNLYYEKGTVLEYNDVHLAESAATRQGYNAAKSRRSRQGSTLNYVSRAFTISSGKAPKSTVGTTALEMQPFSGVLPGVTELPSSAPTPAAATNDLNSSTTTSTLSSPTKDEGVVSSSAVMSSSQLGLSDSLDHLPQETLVKFSGVEMSSATPIEISDQRGQVKPQRPVSEVSFITTENPFR